LLDVAHSDSGAATGPFRNLCIAQQAAFRDDRRKAINVDDVVDLRVLGTRHSRAYQLFCGTSAEHASAPFLARHETRTSAAIRSFRGDDIF
jgi:hypothetical protein